jgi:DNA modification methylase
MATADSAAVASLLQSVSTDSAAVRELLESVRRAAQHPAVPGETDPDAVPERPPKPVTRMGDLWTLGGHRLLCGDATSADDVGKLLGGGVPLLTVTDPPYGVDYDPRWRDEISYAPNRGHRVQNDDRASWLAAWNLLPGNIAYVWHGALHAGTVAADLQTAGFVVRSQLIWVKTNFPISRGHYHWRHEPCWYAVRKGAGAAWVGDRRQTTVIEVESPLGSYGHSKRDAADGATNHGTQKPIEAMERPLRNHEGDVYDPFVGSGTTIIAAERLERRCYAMDIDPAYVDVAVARWEQFTGGKATRERT